MQGWTVVGETVEKVLWELPPAVSLSSMGHVQGIPRKEPLIGVNPAPLMVARDSQNENQSTILAAQQKLLGEAQAGTGATLRPARLAMIEPRGKA